MKQTKIALAEYDAGEAARQALWDAADTNDAVYAAQANDEAAADKVREAFAEDTKDVNSRDHAFLVSPNDPWLRNLVAKHAG